MSKESTEESLSLLYVDVLHAASGGQVHADSFTQAMVELGVDIRRLSLSPEGLPGGGSLRPRPLVSALTPWLRDVLLILRDRQAEGGLRSEAERTRPNALVVRDAPMSSAARRVCERMRLPYFLEVNSPLTYETQRHYRSGLRGVALRRERANWEGAEVIFCVSEVLRDYLLAHSNVAPSRVVVVPNGVDVSRFEAVDSEESRRLRQELGFPPFPEMTVFCFTGTLQPWHGTRELVAAIADLPESCGSMIIGAGKESDAVRQLVDALGLSTRVAMVGRVPHNDIPRYLAACDAAVMPYPRLELFYFSPLKMFEYLAAGLPIIASRQGQIAKLLQDGANGILYSPEPSGEREQLTQALSRFLCADDAVSMRGANRRLAREHTWHANAQRILAVIRSTLESRRGE